VYASGIRGTMDQGVYTVDTRGIKRRRSLSAIREVIGRERRGEMVQCGRGNGSIDVFGRCGRVRGRGDVS